MKCPSNAAHIAGARRHKIVGDEAGVAMPDAPEDPGAAFPWATLMSPV
jgi:hypothetical protein